MERVWGIREGGDEGKKVFKLNDTTLATKVLDAHVSGEIVAVLVQINGEQVLVNTDILHIEQ